MLPIPSLWFPTTLNGPASSTHRDDRRAYTKAKGPFHLAGDAACDGMEPRDGLGAVPVRLLKRRFATAEDCPTLAEMNYQLIRDEGHRNPMTIPQLEERMRGWLASGEYRAILFEESNEVVAYALYRETEAEVYLRQFFVVRHRRREGIGRRAMQELISKLWPPNKRLTVSVLVKNATAVAFWRAIGYTDYDLTLEIRPAYSREPTPVCSRCASAFAPRHASEEDIGMLVGRVAAEILWIHLLTDGSADQFLLPPHLLRKDCFDHRASVNDRRRSEPINDVAGLTAATNEPRLLHGVQVLRHVCWRRVQGRGQVASSHFATLQQVDHL